MLRLRLRDPSGKSHTVSMPQHATLAQLKLVVQQLTTVQPASQQLLLGFPPQPLQPANDEQPLPSCGVRTGDTLTLAIISNTPPPPPPRPAQPSSASLPPPPPAARSSQPPQSSSSVPLLVAGMADDNSCLFHAICFCLAGAAADGGWRSVQVEAAELRQLVAASLLSLSAASASPSSSSTSSAVVAAYLSSLPSVASYAASISRAEVWGGALECAVLSEAFGCRIHAVDVETGTLYPFGSGGSYACYLLFSGVHYDSLYSGAAGSRPVAARTTMFPFADATVREAALVAAEAARSSGNYTSLSAFTLRCEQCGIAVRGQQEANNHAKQTKHTQFSEYR